MGSSPRVWGQVVRLLWFPTWHRIIPTRVGTSFLWRKKKPIYEDHPHACGDKLNFCTVRLWDQGSSPRVWGQEAYSIVPSFTVRIIPTRVGTRKSYRVINTVSQDHPHACGDKTKEIKENSGFAKSTA